MVNTGRPSRGCYMCRARRIKCDEGKPSCARCIKSKRVCPGYRDASELKLLEEGKSTKKKLAKRHFHQAKVGTSDISSCSLPMVLTRQYPHSRSLSVSSDKYHTASILMPRRNSQYRSPSVPNHNTQDFYSEAAMTPQYHGYPNFVPPQIATPINQQASCFFLANFVLIPESGTMRGYLDFIIPLLNKSDTPRPLTFAFSAAAYAALGSREDSRLLLPQAEACYLRALKEINGALKNPKLATSDALIASVMLMAFFEQILPSRMKVGGWASHLDGAVAMIKSRDAATWQSPLFRELFIAVRAHMTIHCIANARHVDSSIDWLAVKASDPVVQNFACLNLKMAALQADNDAYTTLPHTPANIEIVTSLFQRAQELDVEYQQWIRALPKSWAITTVAWFDGQVDSLESSVVHPGRVDSYGELWMVYKYNVVRACRLYIWDTILRCTAWLNDPNDYRQMPAFVMATKICTELVDDIVASVPYFFGWNRNEEAAMADPSNYACGTNDPDCIKPLAGIFSMWPLYKAATSDFASLSQSTFLKGRLKHIAENMGINQAWIMYKANIRHPSMYIARERAHRKSSVSGLSTTSISDGSHASFEINFPSRNDRSSPPLTPSDELQVAPKIGIVENEVRQVAVAMMDSPNMEKFSPMSSPLYAAASPTEFLPSITKTIPDPLTPPQEDYPCF